MVSDDIIRAQLSRTLAKTDFPSLGEKYEGKVRDCYTKAGRRTIVVTDRISAFDVVLGTIPFKGQVLNRIAAHWFEETKGLVPNHVLSIPDPQVTVEKTNAADKQMWEDLPTIPLYAKPTLLPSRDNIINVVDNSSTYGPIGNATKWGVKQ